MINPGLWIPPDATVLWQVPWMKPFGWVWSKDDASRVSMSDKQRGWLGDSGSWRLIFHTEAG